MGILPISRDEFSTLFKKCVPRTGWQKTICVANSGGPDSTCLLFLIHRHLNEADTTTLPRSVVSLTVDHGLQDSSIAMAERCAKSATEIGARHITSRITWSVPPFPPRPSEGTAFEKIARETRFQLLLQAMNSVNANVIAFGHHADDQVETSLMRLAKGSSELGAGGMRRCRRWGMGMGTGETSLGWAGVDGLRKWIVRPLLDVSKDRILATCHENGLEYVVDQTNFQPELTLRNAIRHILSGHDINKAAMPKNILEELDDMHNAVKLFGLDLSAGKPGLRSAVSAINTRIEEIDCEVDAHLEHLRLPSPSGTYLIPTANVFTIQDPIVRTSVVLRIMRYISPHPWGSLRADGKRSGSSMSRITNNIWNTRPWDSATKPFVSGGGVMWTPVVVRQDGGMRIFDGLVHQANDDEGKKTFGWLASRQPPARNASQRTTVMDPLFLDVTKSIKEQKDGIVEILYDNRFLVQFDLSKIPDSLATILRSSQEDKVLIIPKNRWFSPKVVWQKTGEQRTVDLASEVESMDMQTDTSRHRKDIPVSSDWIRISWIRPLGAP